MARIAGVEVPEALVQALELGELVIFAGAGVSMGSPSSLPSFDGLVRDLYASAGVALPEDFPKGRTLDVYLEMLSQEPRVDLRALAEACLDRPTSQPNELHELLVRLCRSRGQLRLVTTNFDHHFENSPAAGSEKILPVFSAPALPRGQRFTGLVYLHGRLATPECELVLSESEFGQAYLTEGWARTFLLDLFRAERTTVLFVGYSHTDPFVVNIGSALGSQKRGYALAPSSMSEADRSHWRRLQIPALEYSSDGVDHSALVDFIRTWTSDSEAGLLARQTRLEELVRYAPTADPESISFIVAALADVALAEHFAKHADPSWIPWCAEQGLLGVLSSDQESTPAQRTLAMWVARLVCTDTLGSRLALAQVFANRGAIGFFFWGALAQEIWTNEALWHEDVPTWIHLLLGSAPAQTSSVLEYLLVRSLKEESPDLLLTLLSHLMHPVVRVDLPFSTERRNASVELRGDVTWLNHVWDALRADKLPALCAQILPIVEGHLAGVYRAHRAAYGLSFDALEYRRQSIGGVSPHGSHDAVDVLISSARDALLALTAPDPLHADDVLRRWASSPDAIFRRLATWVAGARSDWDATTKLAWLLEHAPPADGMNSEARELLRDCLDPGSDAAAQLLEAAMAAPADKAQARRLFDLLLTLQAAGVPHDQYEEDLTATALIGELTYPWIEEPPAPTPPRLSARELSLRWAEDPSGLVEKLLDAAPLAGRQSWDRGQDFSDFAVAEPRSAALLAAALLEGPEPRLDLSQALIEGLSQAEQQAVAWPELLDSLARLTELEPAVPAICRLLEKGASAADAWGPEEFVKAQVLARKIWSSEPTEGPALTDADPLTVAMNHWAGMLAEVYIRHIGQLLESAGTAWTGLPASLAAELTLRVEAGSEAAGYFRRILFTRTAFLVRADAGWVSTVLMPFLDPGRNDTALAEWGCGIWGPWSYPALDAGLRHAIELNLSAAEQMDAQGRRRLGEHLAGVAVHSDDPQLNASWVLTLQTSATSQVSRSFWRSLHPVMKAAGGARADAAWRTWLGPLLQAWAQGSPRRIDEQTASDLLRIVVTLDETFVEATEVMGALPVSLGEHSTFLAELSGSPRIASHPDEVVRLLLHSMKGTAKPFYNCSALGTIARSLPVELAEGDREAITEAALGLGCGDPFLAPG